MKRQVTLAMPIGASIGWLAGVSLWASTEWGPLLGVVAGYLLGRASAHPSRRSHFIFGNHRSLSRTW